MDNIQQIQIQNYQLSQSSKDKFSNHYDYNIQNKSVEISKEQIESYKLESKLNSSNQQPDILKQLYDNDEQCSITLKKNKKIKQKSQNGFTVSNNQCIDNQFREYEKVQLFDNDFTKVTIQFNEEIKSLTIKKYFKQINKSQFENEIEILKKFAEHEITLPLVSYSKNNELWYEQIAGQKDFLIIRNCYSYENQTYKQHDYIENLKIIFSKLYLKLDKMFELGYAHSDIKPQNIVLGFDFEPYFIDFGASVKLTEFKNYLNQFTPLYNHSRYIQKNEFNNYKKYNFTNEEEVKQCDRIQLAISILYLIIKTYEYFSYNNQKKIKNDNIILLNEYFRQKEFNKIFQLFITDQDQITNKMREQLYYNTKFNVLEKFDEYIQIVDDLIDILNIINEKGDHYERIKHKIYKLSDSKINQDIFSDCEGHLFKRINQYNINLINIYLNEKGWLEVNLNCQNDLQFTQYSPQHRILYNLSRLHYTFKKIFIKKQSNQIIYDIPYIQFPYYQFQNLYDFNIENIQFILNQKHLFNQDNSLINREKIGEEFRSIIKLFIGKEYEYFFQENKICLQNKLLEYLISCVNRYFFIVNNCFKKNIIIAKIYEVDFTNEEFFNQIFNYSNERNEFELVFINCKFNKNLLIKIESFIKRYNTYEIFYCQEDTSEIKQSSICCHASTDDKINEISEQTQQKRYIKLTFIHTAQYLNQYFVNQMKLIELFNNKNNQQKWKKDVKPILYQPPFYSVLYSEEVLQLLKILESNHNNSKKLNYQTNIDTEYEISFIINENIFLNYFFSDYQDDQISLKQNIIDNFIILNINGIQYLITKSLYQNIASFLNFQSQVSSHFLNDKEVLIITILGQKKEYQIDEQNCEQQIDEKNKMRKIKNLLEQLLIDNTQTEVQFINKSILKIIQLEYKMNEELNEIFDSYEKQNEFNTYQQYQASDYQRDYHTLLKLFNNIIFKEHKQSQTYQQVHQFSQFQRRFNSELFIRYFSDDFKEELRQLNDLIIKKLLCKYEYINGKQMCQILKQQFNVQIQHNENDILD